VAKKTARDLLRLENTLRCDERAHVRLAASVALHVSLTGLARIVRPDLAQCFDCEFLSAA
jgi:hypothetical protein